MPVPRFALLFCPLVFVAACSASQGDGDGVGDTGDRDTSALTGSGCDRDTLLAATSGMRRTAIERGLAWYDVHVPYSQSRTHDGYRTDCSGFVSMCWQLDQSYTTADFSSGGGGSHALSSYDELLPGDALVYRAGGEGHIILFAGWQDDLHASACVLEERSIQLGLQFHARDASTLRSSGYKAIRDDAFPDATSASGSSDTPPSPDPATPPSPPTPSGGSTPHPPDPNAPPANPGDPCTLDGDCCPGLECSGLICVDGACAPGCKRDNQCATGSHCFSGQCQ